MLRRSSRVTRQSSWICGIPSASFVRVRVTRLAGLGSCSHRTRAVATVFVVTPWAASSSIPRRVPGKSSSTRGIVGRERELERHFAGEESFALLHVRREEEHRLQGDVARLAVPRRR